MAYIKIGDFTHNFVPSKAKEISHVCGKCEKEFSILSTNCIVTESTDEIDVDKEYLFYCPYCKNECHAICREIKEEMI